VQSNDDCSPTVCCMARYALVYIYSSHVRSAPLVVDVLRACPIASCSVQVCTSLCATERGGFRHAFYMTRQLNESSSLHKIFTDLFHKLTSRLGERTGRMRNRVQRAE